MQKEQLSEEKSSTADFHVLQIQTLIQNNKFFEPLLQVFDQPTIKKIVSSIQNNTEIIECKQGDLIYQSSSPVKTFHMILNGQVQVYSQASPEEKPAQEVHAHLFQINQELLPFKDAYRSLIKGSEDEITAMNRVKRVVNGKIVAKSFI